MSYSELDSMTEIELLKLVVIELRILTRHLELMNDEEISEEDIEHDY